MSTIVEPDGAVPLTVWDAYQLAALTEGPPKRGPIDLRTFVGDYDWLNRLIVDFDDLSYGLPRLEAAGYVTIDRSPDRGLLLSPTPAAWALRRSYRAKTLGDVVVGMERALGVERQHGPGDRTLGRLPDFEPEELDRAIADYEREFWREFRIWSIVFAPLMLVLWVWLRVMWLIDRLRGIDPLAPTGDPRLVRLLPPTMAGARIEGHGYVGVDMDEEAPHVQLLRRLGKDGSDTAQAFGFVDGAAVELSAIRVGGVDGRGLVDAWMATFGQFWVGPAAEGTWSVVEGQAVYIVPVPACDETESACAVPGEDGQLGLVPLPGALVTLLAPRDAFGPHLSELIAHLVAIDAF